MKTRKKVPSVKVEYEYHYSICVDTNVTLRDGVEWYAFTSRVFKPRKDLGDEACKQCLDVWNSEIVPVTTTEMGARYRYSVDEDWGTGNYERTELRYSDEWIRFDLRFNRPMRLKNARPEPVRLPEWLVAGARLTARRS
jgi:hypothetical protein